MFATTNICSQLVRPMERGNTKILGSRDGLAYDGLDTTIGTGLYHDPRRTHKTGKWG
jgi:hypothetical protein